MVDCLDVGLIGQLTAQDIVVRDIESGTYAGIMECRVHRMYHHRPAVDFGKTYGIFYFRCVFMSCHVCLEEI